MNTAEILALKYPNADFIRDIQLQDHGDGKVVIGVWNLSDPEPSQKDLDRWAIEFELPYRQQLAVQQRVYPSIGDQLDMIYKDQLNGTSVFKDTISAIKLAHPKPLS